MFDRFFNASFVGSSNKAVSHPELDLPLLADFQSCAVVASSNILRYHPKGKEIDAHTAIFRFNNAPTKGYEEIVGNRTTIRLHARSSCNLEKANIAFSLHPPPKILRTDKRVRKSKEKFTQKPEGDACETLLEPSQVINSVDQPFITTTSTIGRPNNKKLDLIYDLRYRRCTTLDTTIGISRQDC